VATDEVELESSLADMTNQRRRLASSTTRCAKASNRGLVWDSADNKLVARRAMMVPSDRDPDDLLKAIQSQPYAWNLLIVPSPPSGRRLCAEGTLAFGLWLDNDATPISLPRGDPRVARASLSPNSGWRSCASDQ